MAERDFARLTEKEEEALLLVHQRLTSKQIARRLGISPGSVNKRLDAARRKLQAPTRLDAARWLATELYGESLTGSPLPVQEFGEQEELDGAEPSIDHQRQPGARLDPAKIGPFARTLIIIGGAAAMLILVLMALGIAEGVTTLLDYVLGTPTSD